MTKSCGFWGLLLILALLGPVVECQAFGGDKALVTINGKSFTAEDYRHWWHEWQEPDTPFPETFDEFVDWMLLSQEARDMQLHENLNYRKKMQVFLKVRALMQLKAEEVDIRKTIPPREELWQAYREGFTPILNLRMLAVTDEEQAHVVRSFLDRGITLDKVAAAAGLKGLAEELEATGPLRFTRIPESLRELALQLKVGEVGGPASFGHSRYFIEVLDRNDGTDEDFETVKQVLIQDALKRQEYQLTLELVEQLKNDYAVEVYNEVIEAIQPGAIDAELAGKIAVKIDQTEVPAKVIFDAAAKAQKLRGQARTGAEDFLSSKARVVNDLLVQTLTSMEALARHYEEIPPLKYTYEFYAQHRLIKELEATILQPQVKVAESDISVYYRENSNDYAREGLLELAIVKTRERELAAKLHDRLKAGEDFFVVMKPIAPAGVEVKKLPLQHLSPQLQKEVGRLSDGQVVGGIEEGEEVLFIKLVRKGEQEFAPLEMVKEQIREQLLNDRFAQLRTDMIKQLRQRSVIKANRSVWKKLRKALQREES